MLNQTQNRILAFFLRHPDFAWKMINGNYRFTDYLIGKHEKAMDWELISGNSSLIWMEEFIDRHKERLNWKKLSTQYWLPANEEFIRKYKDWLVWSRKPANFMESPAHMSFSMNPSMKWTVQLIEEFRNYLDWKDFQLNSGEFWSEDTVEAYADSMNWEKFTPGYNEEYSKEFIRKYIGRTEKPYWKLGIVDNPELVDEYSNDVMWEIVSGSNKIKWTPDLRDRWLPRLDPGTFASNGSATKGRDGLNFILDTWKSDKKYIHLSLNPDLNWDEELVDRYRDRWNWGFLSTNVGLPWSVEFIDKNIKWLKFGETFPDSYPNSDSFICYPGLSNNYGLPQSIEMLEKFEGHWDFEQLDMNVTLWEKAFYTHVDEEMVDLFFRITT